MSNKNKSAFPRPAANYGHHVITKDQKGMTLREYYAGLAMQAGINATRAKRVCNSEEITQPYGDFHQIAEDSVKQADILIKELEK